MRNVLRTLAALCEEDRICLGDLPQVIRQGVAQKAETPEASDSPLDCAERSALVAILEAQRWHMTHAAQELGVSRNTLYRKLRKHGISR